MSSPKMDKIAIFLQFPSPDYKRPSVETLFLSASSVEEARAKLEDAFEEWLGNRFGGGGGLRECKIATLDQLEAWIFSDTYMGLPLIDDRLFVNGEWVYSGADYEAVLAKMLAEGPAPGTDDEDD